MKTFQLIVALYALLASGLSIETMRRWFAEYKYRAPKRLIVLTVLCFLMDVAFILIFL